MPHKDNNKTLKSNSSGENNFISEADLQLIRDLPIEEVIKTTAPDLQLKPSGRNLTACCPFHEEKTPSFSVSPAKNLFNCFSCGIGGDSITFVENSKQLTFQQACLEIAANHGITIQQHESSNEETEQRLQRDALFNVNLWASKWFAGQLKDPKNTKAAAYLRSRDISNESITSFNLGYAPGGWTGLLDAAKVAGYTEEQLLSASLIVRSEKDEKVRYFDRFRDRIIFPVHDHLSRVAGFAGRTLKEPDKDAGADQDHASRQEPKYLNSSETQVYSKSAILYGLHHARRTIRETKNAFLVEGYFDVIRLHQIGITGAVAICGTGLSEKHIELIKRTAKSVTIIGDVDKAGQGSVERSANMIINHGLVCKNLPLPTEKSDPDSFFQGKDEAGFREFEAAVDPKDYIYQFAMREIPLHKEPDQISTLVKRITSLVKCLPDDMHSYYYGDLNKLCPVEGKWQPKNGKAKAIDPASTSKQKGTDNQGDPNEERLKELHNFYFIEKDRNLQYKGIKIDRVNFIEKLKGMGYLRLDTDIDSCSFVQACNNTLREVSTTVITDRFIDFIENIEGYQHQWEGGSKFVDNFILKRKIYDGIDQYFSGSLLKRLKPEQPIRIKRDTRDEKFLFYQNGFVSVTEAGYSFHDYTELDQYIWANQMLNRNFNSSETYLDRPAIFQQFIWNICNRDEERLSAMQTIIGYTLHNYMDCKLWAIILTDSRISLDGEANGRTGKTLCCKALGHMLNTDEKGSVYKELNGKDFKPGDKFKFEEANLDTQLIHINDIYNDYNIENSFNDISEGIKVDKKYDKPIRIRPKFIFSTNKTIIIEGESAKDRVVQFEFADYYNSEFSPIQEFGTVTNEGKFIPHYFFTDWDDEEWARFDHFMITCINEYFKHGLIRPAEINLSQRNLIDHTSDEFLKFMEDAMSEDGISFEQDENGLKSQISFRIINHISFSKRTAYNTFVRMNSDFNNPKFKQRHFTRWLRMFAKYRKYNFTEHRSHGIDYFTINW